MGIAPVERTPVRQSLSLFAVVTGLAAGAASLGSTSEPPISAATPSATAPPVADPAQLPRVILVVGAAGESEFGTNFLQQAEVWQQACLQAGAPAIAIGLEEPGETTDRARLESLLAAESPEGLVELWLVLIGHGTFDGKVAKFNLRGPDFTAEDLAAWLQPFHRPLAVINTASSSAPFLRALAGTNRVLITATRSGYEQNFTRFGSHFAAALSDPEADLDGDRQNSLLEAYLVASRRVAEFYQTEGRLATEHALLDDNGDGLGTPADWFRGLRATKRPKDKTAVDGLRAHQFHLIRSPDELSLSPEARAQRDDLERRLAALRDSKGNLEEDDYYRRLESLLLDLARLYAPPASSGSAPEAHASPAGTP